MLTATPDIMTLSTAHMQFALYRTFRIERHRPG